MKKFIFILLLLSCFLTTNIQAESVTLVWTPSISNDVVSYRIYQSLIENIFAIGPECNAVMITDKTDECMTRAIVSELIVGCRYHFVVTSIDIGGNESDPSNTVSITIDPENANPISIGSGDIRTTIQ